MLRPGIERTAAVGVDPVVVVEVEVLLVEMSLLEVVLEDIGGSRVAVSGCW